MSFRNSQPVKKTVPDPPFRQFLSINPEELPGMIDLTGLFQQTLQKSLSQTDRNSVVIRLDKLPLVAGSKEQFEQLCDTLIALIVTRLLRGGRKLFLHIKCEKPNEDVIDLNMTSGFTPYSISFCTNILPNNNWKFFVQEKLNECAVIARKNKGTFSFQQAFGSCCLFSLTFPGKLD